MTITRIGAGPRMSKAVVHGNTVYLGSTPARATVEAKLAAPEYTVEIAAIAAR